MEFTQIDHNNTSLFSFVKPHYHLHVATIVRQNHKTRKTKDVINKMDAVKKHIKENVPSTTLPQPPPSTPLLLSKLTMKS